MIDKGEETKDYYDLVKPKTVHFKISRRDTLVNDLKNGTAEGAVSLIFSMVSLIGSLLITYISYTNGGTSGLASGIACLFFFLLSAVGIGLSQKGLQRKDKSRHRMEKIGLTVHIAVLVLLIALYIFGWTKL